MKILFFPSDLGGGWGHLNRCHAFADYARHQGDACAFVLHQPQLVEKFRPEFKTYHVPLRRSYAKRIWTQLKKGKTNRPQPYFVTLSRVEYQVIRDGLTEPDIIADLFVKYRRVIQDFQPDLLISDMNLIVGAVASWLKYPLIQIIRAGFFPGQGQLIWWQTLPPELQPPDVRPLFNPVFKRFHLPPLENGDALLTGAGYLIPSIPEIEPVALNDQTHYVGALLKPVTTRGLPEWLKHRSPDLPLIYVTIGGGASSVGSAAFFRTVIEALREPLAEVLISVSDKFDPALFGSLPAHLHLEKWAPGRAVIEQSDLVIFHGGYGTMMETVMAAKPSLVTPSHSEQESNGRRLESLGCSRVCHLSDAPPQLVRHTWRYGEFTTFIQTDYTLSAEKLKSHVLEILPSPSIRQNSRNLQRAAQAYSGVALAYDKLQQFLPKSGK